MLSIALLVRVAQLVAPRAVSERRATTWASTPAISRTQAQSVRSRRLDSDSRDSFFLSIFTHDR
jgi:hypothetical protein